MPKEAFIVYMKKKLVDHFSASLAIKEKYCKNNIVTLKPTSSAIHH